MIRRTQDDHSHDYSASPGASCIPCPVRIRFHAVVALSLPLIWLAGTASAQDRRAPGRPAVPASLDEFDSSSVPPAKEADDSEGLGQLYRDFGFPGAIRAWERSMYLSPDGRADDGRGYYGRYPHRPYRYGGYHYLYDYSYEGDPYGRYSYRRWDESGQGNYELPLDRAVDLGVGPREIERNVRRQAMFALNNYRDAMNAGHDSMARGDFVSAARAFMLAAELNQGDPSSRLCAAHAQVGLGRFSEAASMVHRAFELQPKLAFITVDIPSAFPDPATFSRSLNRLEAAARRQDVSALWFAVGYFRYNSGNAVGAAEALDRAAQLDPQDLVAKRFAEAAGASAPVGNRSRR
ncbi:MAG: hypothetical protein J5J06_05195 [Phycisphaerae bacterium]|nr:hypothetical protein [Phycisphaerae bacterium]